jgi:hypothetical protein
VTSSLRASVSVARFLVRSKGLHKATWLHCVGGPIFDIANRVLNYPRERRGQRFKAFANTKC